jgi:hypothetical protein
LSVVPIRSTVADELARALAAGRPISNTADSDPDVDDLEDTFGAKLDRMLGGLGNASE